MGNKITLGSHAGSLSLIEECAEFSPEINPASLSILINAFKKHSRLASQLLRLGAQSMDPNIIYKGHHHLTIAETLALILDCFPTDAEGCYSHSGQPESLIESLPDPADLSLLFRDHRNP